MTLWSINLRKSHLYLVAIDEDGESVAIGHRDNGADEISRDYCEREDRRKYRCCAS